MPKIGQHPTQGTPVQLDDTDKFAVSLYGQDSAAGDTSLLVDDVAQEGLRTVVYYGGAAARVSSIGADGGSSALNALLTKAVNHLYNGSTLDRQRANVEETVAASAERTAALTSSDLTNYNARGALIFVNVTARAAATTLDLTLEAKDPVSGEYKEFFDIAAAINTADDTLIYQIYPTLPHANLDYTEEVEGTLPRTFRIVVTPNDANGVTYSVAIVWLL